MRRALAQFGLLTTLLTGCILPHTTERTGEVRGRVVDAQSDATIVGVKIHWATDSTPTARTDPTGRFTLLATKNFHVLMFRDNGWPLPDPDPPRILVLTHPDYRTTSVDVISHATKSQTNGILQLQDIRLDRNSN